MSTFSSINQSLCIHSVADGLVRTFDFCAEAGGDGDTSRIIAGSVDALAG